MDASGPTKARRSISRSAADEIFLEGKCVLLGAAGRHRACGARPGTPPGGWRVPAHADVGHAASREQSRPPCNDTTEMRGRPDVRMH